MKIQNCLDCDASRKWLLEYNQTNQNPKNYKSKEHYLKGIIRV